MLVKNNIDIVAGQESWEKDDSRISIEGYKWFGKPRSNQNSQRGEGGVGFLVRECLVNEVECTTSDQSVWMKVHGGRSALYIGCVYMPTDSTVERHLSKLQLSVHVTLVNRMCFVRPHPLMLATGRRFSMPQASKSLKEQWLDMN